MDLLLVKQYAVLLRVMKKCLLVLSPFAQKEDPDYTLNRLVSD